jgi:outer membrane protein
MTAIFTRTRLIAAAAVACAALTPALSQAGDFMVRGRVLYLDPANENSTTNAAALPENVVEVNSKYIWEIDGSYFITPNIALELIATTPQKQTVYAGSQTEANKLGTLRHLPPTLTLQYHLAPNNAVVRPYIGVGVNYTHFSGVKLADGALDLERHSWGTAFQVGADFPITQNISFNVDFKKIDIRADVKVAATGQKLGTVKVDPVLFGIGIGYRF